jgi:hypothetical protein
MRTKKKVELKKYVLGESLNESGIGSLHFPMKADRSLEKVREGHAIAFYISVSGQH